MKKLSIYFQLGKAILDNECKSLKINHAFSNASAITTIKKRGSSFIHINKNGGSTIEKVLGFQDQLHMPYRVLEDNLGVFEAQQLKTSVMIRNPYDRVVSQYQYRFDQNQMGYSSKNLTFSDFVRMAYKEKSENVINYPLMFAPQIKWIEDYRGNINHIGCLVYFENFESSVRKIADFHGVKTRDFQLPRKRSSSRKKPWQEYYDEETKSIILDHFRRDFETFDYSEELE